MAAERSTCRHFRGNKLPDCEENPVDVVILRVSEWLLPLLRRTGHTPNAITTYGLVCKALLVHAVWCGRPGATVAFGLAAYALDCVDGQLARAYGMTSRWGDWYDHGTDLALWVSLGLVVAVRHRAGVRPWHLGLALLALGASAVAMGCAQRQRPGREAETLDGVAGLCPAASAKRWVRRTRCVNAATGGLVMLWLLCVWIGPGGNKRKE